MDRITALLEALPTWAKGRFDIYGVALVGSHARGAAEAGSDVDVVLLVEDPAPYLTSDDWIAAFGTPGPIEDEDYGLVRSRRVRYDGLEVEWGIAGMGWATDRPVDPATAKVVNAGMKALYDPYGMLAALAEAAAR